MSSNKEVSFTRLNLNSSDNRFGQEFKLKHGEGFSWHAENGNPEITVVLKSDGSPHVTIQYLGENHRKLSELEIARDIKRRLKIFRSSWHHDK
jgi:hypothetical protein